MYTNHPIDLSLSKNQNSLLDLSDKTVQLLDNPYIKKKDKIEIIQKRRAILQAKLKKRTLILIFKLINIYNYITLNRCFFV